MTEFFNKKEETLHIELTEHGKYMLSQGLLKPAYYCFYDDIQAGTSPIERFCTQFLRKML